MKRTFLAVLLLTLCVPALSAQTAGEPMLRSPAAEVPAEALRTPASEPVEMSGALGDPQAPSSCYQACLSAQDSLSWCPAYPTPLVAEVYVTGPEHSAQVSSFNCVPSCFGPVVTITGFSSCGP